MNFTEKINRFVRSQPLLETGDTVVAAVSGGIDSVTLFDVLLELREQYRLRIVVAHLNHCLRGEESDGDEQFVRDLAAARGVECHVDRRDARAEAEERKLSIQEAARDLRYEFFSRIRDSLGFSKIATGHNADDNAETVVLNLLRGSGVRGLGGIPPMRKDLRVIRPLLAVSRAEIEAYARERNLHYRTDSSNLTDHYTRNSLRHTIFPLLKNVNPDLVQTLGRTAEFFRELDDELQKEARKVQSEIVERRDQEEIVLNITKLGTNPVFLQEYCLLLAAREFVSKELEHSAVKSIMSLIKAETGSMAQFARDGVAFRDRDRLVFRREFPETFRFIVEPNKSYRFDHFTFSSTAADSFWRAGDGTVEYVDAERIGETLVLRSWADGDWFYPLGLGGKKKLSDFFIDAKIPLYQKHMIPVLESAGEIVWVCGKRIDDRFKVREGTRRILKLEYSPRTPA